MSKSIKVLREQKEEYMEHLFDIVYEPFVRVYQQMYQEVLKSKETTAKNVLKVFQHELSKIPDWNQSKVEEVYAELIARGKCSYFPELMKTVYVLTIKIILLGIPEESRSKVKIRIPGPETFVHRCLIHIARELWKRPYLFYHQARSIDRQNNIYHCEVIVRKKLRSVIRETIPMEWMVVQFNEMDHIEQEESSSSEEEESEPEEESEEEASEEEEEDEEDEEEGEEDEEEESESEEEDEEEEAEAGPEEEEEAEEEEQETEEESSPEEDLPSLASETEPENTVVVDVLESEEEESSSSSASPSPTPVPSFPPSVPRIDMEPQNFILPNHMVQLDSDLSSQESSPVASDSEDEIIQVDQEEDEILTVHEMVRPPPVLPVPAPEDSSKKLIHIHESKKKHRRHHKKKDAFF